MVKDINNYRIDIDTNSWTGGTTRDVNRKPEIRFSVLKLILFLWQ